MTSPGTRQFDIHSARLAFQFFSPLPPTPLPESQLFSANSDVAPLGDPDPEQAKGEVGA
jgi:hypothetical protein